MAVMRVAGIGVLLAATPTLRGAWLTGVVLVLAAFAIRMLRPEWQWYTYLAIGGLVCTLLYTLSQWREITRSFSGREARFGSLACTWMSARA